MEILFIWFLFGIVAAVIANSRGRGGCGWFIIGTLLGPFALIVAFLPSATQKAMDKAAERGEYGKFKKCPFCAEIVKIEAVKCKHCGSELPRNPINQSNNIYDAAGAALGNAAGKVWRKFNHKG
ncbi:MAG: zinc ribbon domain-containing protein [Proteobacteria bacterium]|nr:zinc ribbon domain-containing protein [Pseudomonadota bacterium]